MEELTLRDRLAMSMPTEAIPEMNDREALQAVCKAFGLEWDDDDVAKQIEFSLKYLAIIRYMYADAMMAVRPNE